MFLSCRRALQLQVPTNDDDIDGNAAALPGAVDDIDYGHHPAGRNRGWQKTAGYDNRGGFLSEFSISKYFFFSITMAHCFVFSVVLLSWP